MIIIMVLASIVVGLAAGAIVAVVLLQRQHQSAVAQREQLSEQQLQAQLDAQAAAVDAAVRQVLHEREATATATAAAVTADREATVTAAVEQWRERWPAFVPLPHPSPRNQGWFKRNPWFADELLPKLRRRVRRVIGS